MPQKASKKSGSSRRAAAGSSKRRTGKAGRSQRASPGGASRRKGGANKKTTARRKTTAPRTAQAKTARAKTARAKTGRAGAARRRATKGSGERKARRSVGDEMDFGISPGRREAALNVSKRTKRDPPAARAGMETREAGVGGRESGPGSHSGGDVDSSITGVGTGGSSISQAGPDTPDQMGAAETTGGSEEFASGPPARGRNQLPPGQIGGAQRVRGSTVDRGEASTLGPDAETETPATEPGRAQATEFGAGHADMDEMPDDAAADRSQQG